MFDFPKQDGTFPLVASMPPSFSDTLANAHTGTGTPDLLPSLTQIVGVPPGSVLLLSSDPGMSIRHSHSKAPPTRMAAARPWEVGQGTPRREKEGKDREPDTTSIQASEIQNMRGVPTMHSQDRKRCSHKMHRMCSVEFSQQWSVELLAVPWRKTSHRSRWGSSHGDLPWGWGWLPGRCRAERTSNIFSLSQSNICWNNKVLLLSCVIFPKAAWHC